MAEPFEPPPAYDGVPTAPPHSGYNPGYPPPQQPYYPPDPGYPPPQQQPYYDQPGQPPYHDQMPQGAPGYQGYQGYPPPSQPMAAYPPPQGKPAPTAHGYHQPYPKSVQYGGQPYQAARNPKRAPRRQRPRAPASAYQPIPPTVQQQSTTNVVVVNQQPAPVQQQVIMQETHEEVNHALHCILTFCFPPWIFIWICCCLLYGC